jgi:hypothetical protein
MRVLLAALYWGTGSSSTNAAFALPRPDALSSLPDRPYAVRRLVSAYTIHIMPDNMGIPSSASLANRGGPMQPLTLPANFALSEFSDVRLSLSG